MFDIDLSLLSLVLVTFVGVALAGWTIMSIRRRDDSVKARGATVKQNQIVPVSHIKVSNAIKQRARAKPSENEGIALTKVQGIGPTFSKRLQAAGITSVEDLIQYSAKDLSSSTGFSEKIATTWINNANKLV
jgi:predicted flap endonuclease-1-like 5' DNA nuclease